MNSKIRMSQLFKNMGLGEMELISGRGSKESKTLKAGRTWQVEGK